MVSLVAPRRSSRLRGLKGSSWLCRLEAAKDDYRIHCEELEKQLIEVQHRNDELTSLAEESRALKDELDVLRFVGQLNQKDH